MSWTRVSVHAALLLLALLAAYLTWTRGTDQPPQSRVRVWDLGGQRAVELRIEGRKRTVVIRQEPGPRGEACPWIRVYGLEGTKREAPAAGPADGVPDAGVREVGGPDASAPEAAVPDATPPARPEPGRGPETGPPTRELHSFRGGQRAEELLEEAARLDARRDLGRLAAGEMREMGLHEAELELVVRGTEIEHRLLIGAEVYGQGQRYARDPESGRVYVLSGSFIRELQRAEARLLDHRLHPFEPRDADRVEVAARGKRVTLLQHEPGARTPAEAAFLDKLSRLKVRAYAGLQEHGLAPGEEPLLDLRYLGGSKELGFSRLYGPATEGASSSYRAVSDHTRGHLVELGASLVEELLKDADLLLQPASSARIKP